MNKLMLIISSIVILSVVFPIASAVDIAYVTKVTPDPALTALITEKGYTYDIINPNNINAVNLSAYKMILIGNEKFLSSEAVKIPISKGNAVIIDSTNAKDWGLRKKE